jgi:hypothetical protein
MGLEAVVLGTIGLAIHAKGEQRVRRAAEPHPSRADVVGARDRRAAATRDSNVASSSPPFAPTSG